MPELTTIEAAPPPRRINLTTARHLAREWRAIYREARCGRLPLADASRLAYLLQVGCRMYEVQTLEDRVAALEAQASEP